MSSDPQLPPVSISRLVLTNFRSYARAEFLLDARPVVLAGENGTGKTNVLEAVSLLGAGRGLRGAQFADLARRDGDGSWAVAATLETPDGQIALGTGQTPDPAQPDTAGRSRIVRIDGQTQTGSGALAERLALVWLTPQMDRLFVESASGRRRFLDRLIIGFDPAHGTRVAAYERALRERNRLLAQPRPDPHWLTALEEQIAEQGVAMAVARIHMLARLQSAIDERTATAFPQADLALDGSLEMALSGRPAVDVEDEFRAALAAARPRDAAAGRALEGPHRTDLLAIHREKRVEAHLCSTGEQKALLIGIILANTALLRRKSTVPALLLLDEIAAHLDERRRAALFDEICALKVQAWMTGTDRSLFSSLEDRAQAFRVGPQGPLPETLK